MIDGITYNFRGSIALVPADNLASQSIGGYKALNSALRKCRFCMAVSESMCSEVHCKYMYAYITCYVVSMGN